MRRETCCTTTDPTFGRYVVVKTRGSWPYWSANRADRFVRLTPKQVRWTGDDLAEAREQARKANREDAGRTYGRQGVLSLVCPVVEARGEAGGVPAGAPVGRVGVGA